MRRTHNQSETRFSGPIYSLRTIRTKQPQTTATTSISRAWKSHEKTNRAGSRYTIRSTSCCCSNPRSTPHPKKITISNFLSGPSCWVSAWIANCLGIGGVVLSCPLRRHTSNRSIPHTTLVVVVSASCTTLVGSFHTERLRIPAEPFRFAVQKRKAYSKTLERFLLRAAESKFQIPEKEELALFIIDILEGNVHEPSWFVDFIRNDDTQNVHQNDLLVFLNAVSSALKEDLRVLSIYIHGTYICLCVGSD